MKKSPRRPGNLEEFSIARYTFILQAKETLSLPPYKGSTFRGGFGSVFRKVTCVNKTKECPDCLLKYKCIYSCVFESRPPPDGCHLSKYRSIPRPFVIEPPAEEKQIYRPKESFSFNLILIGKAIEYLPYFIFTFYRLGERGLGKDRGRVELVKVESPKNGEKEVIYQGKTQILKNINARIDLSRMFSGGPQNSDCLTLRFITPLRIKHEGSYISQPDFHIIFRALLRRLSSLFFFHCGKELEVDYKGLIKEAKKIDLIQAEVRWIDWERYSRRQSQRMKLGGFTGRASYEGDLSKFLPFLKVGEYTHVGKAAVFGLGKYQLLPGLKED